MEWELAHLDYLLQALSSSASDHAPLHLSTSAQFSTQRRFCFELYWIKLDGFEDAVRDAWMCDDTITDPFKRLDTHLRNTAAHLQAWGQRKMGNIKMLMKIANWVIFRFDRA